MHIPRLEDLAARVSGVLILTLCACSTAPAPSVDTGVPPAEPSSAASQQTAPSEPSPPPEGDASSTLVEVIGRLRTSKGLFQVGPVLVRGEELEAKLGPDWRRLLERRVRLRGHQRVHVCQPEEQCLVEGELHLLERLESAELCRQAGRAPPGSLDCAVGPEELSACEADCQRESDACDAASQGGKGMGLKRCGCAFISCKRTCRTDGEPAFACR